MNFKKKLQKPLATPNNYQINVYVLDYSPATKNYFVLDESKEKTYFL